MTLDGMTGRMSESASQKAPTPLLKFENHSDARYLPLEVFLPRNLGVESQRHGEGVAVGRIGQFGGPLRGVHEVGVRGVVDETTSVRHRAHQAERVDVVVTVVLDETKFAVDARKLVGLEDRRIATVLVTLGHDAARLARVRWWAWFILLSHHSIGNCNRLRFLMRLFNSSNMDIINRDTLLHFKFSLPSELIQERRNL